MSTWEPQIGMLLKHDTLGMVVQVLERRHTEYGPFWLIGEYHKDDKPWLIGEKYLMETYTPYILGEKKWSKP